MSNSCDCIHCRRQEIGEAYWMHEYTYIVEGVGILQQLIDTGVPYGGLDSEGLPNLRSALECNIDEAISCLEYDYESEVVGGMTFYQALEKWKLKEKYSNAVNLFMELTRN